jgi:hypothetical protein
MRHAMTATTFSLALLAVMAMTFTMAGAQTKPMLLGGYAPASAKSSDVTAAARFAVKARAQTMTGTPLRLLKVRRAEQQVVAGKNYRLCMDVRVSGHRQRVLAIVYRDLSQVMSLSQWTDDGC